RHRPALGGPGGPGGPLLAEPDRPVPRRAPRRARATPVDARRSGLLHHRHGRCEPRRGGHHRRGRGRGRPGASAGHVGGPPDPGGPPRTDPRGALLRCACRARLRRGTGGGVNRARVLTVARTDLRQLWQSKDFWVPMLLLGGIFFVFVPGVLLTVIDNIGSAETTRRLSETLDALPASAVGGID